MPLGGMVRLPIVAPAKPVRFAVITDLHHGLAPDAMSRLQTFADAVAARPKLDMVLQLGDFCYSTPESKECLDLFNTIKLPRVHVLGNHDMDKCDKAAVIAAWGMPSRYGSYRHGGFRFIVLDLNHFRKGVTLTSYANGNYFAEGVTHNWADPEQLEWLGKELRTGSDPTIILSHQPLGFAEPSQPLPKEQEQVMKVVREAKRANPRGAAVLFLCGHLHVDRLERPDDTPCLCVNSASYFWHQGMRPYTKPLFAFMTIDEQGVLRVEGRSGEFQQVPPEGSGSVIGRSASISDRRLTLAG